MVEQVSFNTSGNDKILVHLTNFSISKLYAVSNIVLMDVRQFFLSQNSHLFGEKYI